MTMATSIGTYLRVLRWIILDDHVDIRDVQAAGSHVRPEEDTVHGASELFIDSCSRGMRWGGDGHSMVTPIFQPHT